jgi:triphosphoribosyl-dephospho-CoA synthase
VSVDLPARLDRAALAALHEELVTWPKPGLVCLRDPGAHADMSASTFFASLRALRGVFARAGRAGSTGVSFAELVELGMDAETRMLAATGGVNTHRGAIFSLGLLAAAAGGLAAEGTRLEPASIAITVAARFSRALRALPSSASHGAEVARRFGVGGARDEAAAGFPHLVQVALPALAWGLARGHGRRAAVVHTLVSLIATLADTNLLYRGGTQGLELAQRGARDFLAAGSAFAPGWEHRLLALHHRFVGRNLSPGGSADLLAAALFLDRLRFRGSSQGGPA